jgi:hypothetical protein
MLDRPLFDRLTLQGIKWCSIRWTIWWPIIRLVYVSSRVKLCSAIIIVKLGVAIKTIITLAVWELYVMLGKHSS